MSEDIQRHFYLYLFVLAHNLITFVQLHIFD